MPQQSRELDQFYTNPIYASQFLATLSDIVDLHDYDVLLEPSAGTGSFFNLLDPSKRIGLDLEPKSAEIQMIDFFDWVAPVDRKILTIGNPPFGKNASLAVKFFNRAASFSDLIAFVVPKTFRKTSLINRLNDQFHLIYDEDVPTDSFIFNDAPYDVWCCSQVWIRKEEKRPTIPTMKLSALKDWFEISSPAEADFAIQRVGGRAGLIRTKDFRSYSIASHYFIKQHDSRVLDIFLKLNFDPVKFNTAGNPSVSPSELCELWTKQAMSENCLITATSTMLDQLCMSSMAYKNR